jgi:hypothetical protein
MGLHCRITLTELSSGDHFHPTLPETALGCGLGKRGEFAGLLEKETARKIGTELGKTSVDRLLAPDAGQSHDVRLKP